MKQFQENLLKHVSVEVCAELLKFKITMMRIEKKPDSKKQYRDWTAEGPVEFKAAHADLAYVLHTSGTTGVPKTVRVPHRCILSNILHLR